MGIRIEEVEAGLVDLGDVIDPEGEPVGPVHPGDILKHEFLEPLGMSVYGLAGALGVPRTRLNDIVLGRRAVTAETALRLARYFGTTAGFWMGLQARYDLEVARASVGAQVDAEVHPRAA